MEGREPGEWEYGWQFHASDPLEQHEHFALLGDLEDSAVDRPAAGPARLRSCAGRGASVWLTVCPTSTLLCLDCPLMLGALRLRLGLLVPQSNSGRCEGCGSVLDDLGYHRLTCTRTARLHARNFSLVQAWRQVFVEAGGRVPRYNVERLLRNCNVRVTERFQRRLDLVVAGTGVARGLPLLCDVTCVSPVTGRGTARSGALSTDGSVVAAAQRHCHVVDYPEVAGSRSGRLFCLGVEVFGRWCEDTLFVVRNAARDCSRGLPRRVRLSTHTRLLRRWWGLLGLAVQRVVGESLLRDFGADLLSYLEERAPRVADLPY